MLGRTCRSIKDPTADSTVDTRMAQCIGLAADASPSRLLRRHLSPWAVVQSAGTLPLNATQVVAGRLAHNVVYLNDSLVD